MRILHMIRSLDPQHGGTVESLLQYVLALTRAGHQNEVLTLDIAKAAGHERFPIKLHTFGPAHGKFGYVPGVILWLQRNGSAYDAIIVHGIWQFQSLAPWLAGKKLAVPYYVFIHGMLDPWFKKNYPFKHLKKILYWCLAEYHILRSARCIFFTSEEEKMLAHKSFSMYKIRECVIRLGIADPPAPDTEININTYIPNLQGRKYILFMSRIDRKKGCGILLRAFANLQENYADWSLVIAGPDLERYQAELREEYKSDRIVWTGMLAGEVKWNTLRAANALVLPSHSENFGIIIAEALACGVPALVTDKVNIHREITKFNAGFTAHDTLEGVQAMLESWFVLDDSKRKLMKENAIRCFQENFSIDHCIDDFIRIIGSNKQI